MTRHFRAAGWWSLGLLLLLGALVLWTGAGALASQQPAAPVDVAILPHLANEKVHFYVTDYNVYGDAADASCAAGYHMASVWEILDPSELTYASDLGTAKTRGDQGSGPVAGWWGWVRTGGDASVANTAGQANCSLWASSAEDQYGTIVRLADVWTSPAVAISPWQAQTWACGNVAPVWCVSDPVYGAFVPFMAKQ